MPTRSQIAQTGKTHPAATGAQVWKKHDDPCCIDSSGPTASGATVASRRPLRGVLMPRRLTTKGHTLPTPLHRAPCAHCATFASTAKNVPVHPRQCVFRCPPHACFTLAKCPLMCMKSVRSLLVRIRKNVGSWFAASERRRVVDFQTQEVGFGL